MKGRPMAGTLSHFSAFVYTEVWLSPSAWVLPFLAKAARLGFA